MNNALKTSPLATIGRASASQLKTQSVARSAALTNTHPMAVRQRKIHEAIQAKSRQESSLNQNYIQRKANEDQSKSGGLWVPNSIFHDSSRVGPTIQLKNPLKRLFNFIKNKVSGSRNNATATPVNIQPTNTQLDRQERTDGELLDDYVKAYNQSRTYHQVRYGQDDAKRPILEDDPRYQGQKKRVGWENILDPETSEPIKVIDNIKLRGLQTVYGGTGAGAQDYETHCFGKIHLGRDLKKRDVNEYGLDMLRPFLPESRTHFYGNKNERQNLGELYRDPDHPTYGAITQQDIPADHLLFGTNEDLIDDYEQGDVKARTILTNIQSNLKDGDELSLNDIASLHRRAVRERRISNAPGVLLP